MITGYLNVKKQSNPSTEIKAILDELEFGEIISMKASPSRQTKY